MIKKLILSRITKSDFQILGNLLIVENDQEHNFATLELPWRNNERNISCIPPGKYVIRKRFSPKFGDHWHIMNVPGRDEILIHKGNFINDTHGCIIVGTSTADINGDGKLDVINSTMAMRSINKILGFETYVLTIE